MPTVALRAEGLTKRYGDLVAVNDLSLEVHQGEVFAILGPNGAGKTTSINMMCGLLKPDAGVVTIHGQPVAGGATAMRARIGVCPQETVLWDRLTCMEQLVFSAEMYAIPARQARPQAEALLERLGLSEKRHKLARTLSGGMRRRLNVALALVHDPDIVVLDEPEAGLDPQSRLLVREYLLSLAQEKTVILTTHNMDEAERVAGRVAIIDHGELLVLDTPAGLKSRLGSGDVVEIGFDGGTGQLELACRALESMAPDLQVHASDETLTLRSLNLVRRLPAILEAIERAGLLTREVRLRENSLEDVFIQLTGRRLRE